MDQISANLAFGGEQLRFTHRSESLSCDMTFAVYLPPQAKSAPAPLIWWLSGLTCTDENFVQKAGAQRAAAEHGVAIVAPDTSPRGEGIPDDAEGAYDFGLGAGFYVNATEAPWSAHYHMYDYVSAELPELVAASLPVDTERQGIMGHSMGGHGALTIALKNPGRFRAASAFAPITSPLNCPWGEKALGGYLGADRSTWRAYDTCALLEDGAAVLPVRVDQGLADDFLDTQLKPELLEAAAADAGLPLELHRHTGYDHSYFFIATFIDAHIAFHAARF